MKPTPIMHKSENSTDWTTAIQCWSFHRFDLWEAFRLAALSGASCVELFPGQKLGGPHGELKFGAHLDAQQLESVRQELEKHQLRIVNFGVVDIPNDEQAARAIFNLAKALGFERITTESLESIDLLEKLAVEYEVNVGFHNHPKPSALWHPETISNALAGRHARLGFGADIGHWTSSGLDALAIVREIAPRIHSFHFKDRGSASEWTHDRPFGTGVLDLAGMLDAAIEAGFNGNVSIEYEHNWEASLAEISQCVGYLTAYRKLRQRP